MRSFQRSNLINLKSARGKIMYNTLPSKTSTNGTLILFALQKAKTFTCKKTSGMNNTYLQLF